MFLDAGAAVGTNQSTAEEIDVSLKVGNAKSNMPKVVTSRLCADAGEGVTREDLENELMKLGRTCAMDMFLTITCSHYGFNVMIASPCDKCFGDGGIQNRNLLQLSCT